MKKIKETISILLIALVGIIIAVSSSMDVHAAGGGVLPSAGIDFVLSGGTSVKSIVDSKASDNSKPSNNNSNNSSPSTDVGIPSPEVSSEIAATASTDTATDTAQAEVTATPSVEVVVEEIPEEEKVVEETIIPTNDKTLEEKEREIEAKQEEEYFKNLVIAQVDRYVNVRADATTESDIVGKLYDKSVGELLEEKDGWYKISSGSCVGYVSAEYCVTGEEAVELAKKVGTRVCTVNTTTLKVREEPSTEATVLGLIPQGDVLIVTEELEGWVKVNIEEGDGYVSLDYVKLSTEFVKAESKEEEEARLAKEEAERQAAIEAANKAQKDNKNNKSEGSSKKQEVYATGGGSELGRAVANYGLQFVGNPYVYGGTSLTNGADCSGFVMSVYKHFGVNLPHSSSADRNVGYAVDGLENAQPGDIICYSGHVAIYIGGGQIVHASTAKTGIKVGYANYRTILCIRRIF